MVPITEWTQLLGKKQVVDGDRDQAFRLEHVESEMPIILPKGVSWIYQIKVQGQVWAEDINRKSSASNGISSLDLGRRLGREENRSEDILLGHSHIQNLKRERKTKREV